jgi:hypothetical protein
MNAALEDEILSTNAIYTPDTLIVTSDTTSSNVNVNHTCILKIPNCNISLRLQFPVAYPDEAPTILGPESSGGAHSRKGEASTVADLAASVLASVFTPGIPCIFDLLAELEPLLEVQGLGTDSGENANGDVPAPAAAIGGHVINAEESSIQDAGVVETTTSPDAAFPAPNWVLSAPLTEKKSVFLARVCRVTSVADAQASISHLLATDKRAARASHNISAWRIREESTTAATSVATYQDFDDDGETAAGGRLLHLLQVMGAWQVVVVVTRHYGGVHLGPDRFRCISAVAREAVVAGGGFLGDGEEEDGGKGSGKSGKSKAKK